MSHQYSATGSGLHSRLISLQTASASATEAPGHHLGLSTPQWRPLHSHAIPVLLNPDVPLRARPGAICKKDLPFFFFWCSLYSKSHFHYLGLPRWHSGKESACQCQRHKNMGFIPGLGRSPGVENGSSLQYSCLENGQRSLVGYHPWDHPRVGHDLATQHSTLTSII